jgi:hypothetical protein
VGTAVAAARTNTPGNATSAPPADVSRGGSTQRLLGWIGVTAGGASLIFGGITAGLAISKKSSLEDDGCVDDICPIEIQDKVDSYNSMRTLSSVGFIAGGLLATAGVVLVLTAPSKQPSPTTALFFSPNQAGVRGSF